jgi:hypothetical protein
MSTKGSKANYKINEMLDEIEDNYSKGGMPDIMQLFVFSDECPHCIASMEPWKKLTDALRKRFGEKYRTGKVELNDIVMIDGEKLLINGKEITGLHLYKMFEATGVPFVVQNFDVNDIRGRGGKIIAREIIIVPWYISMRNEIQPGSFLSTIFKVRNRVIDALYG